MIDECRSRFLGKDGHKRVHCALAVGCTFAPNGDCTDELHKELKKAGHGRAPGKVCGAYYAADSYLARYSPEDRQDLQLLFEKKAGSVICREIRKGKKLSCLGCVETAAEFLKTTAYKDKNYA